MIKKITKIKNFGIYDNYKYEAEETPEFKRFNLIYGWNYSGKTTLSRIFRSFELKYLNEDYEDAKFEIEKSDGTKISENEIERNNLNIRVFNADFIEDNLFWNNDKLNPIFILGEENIETQKKITQRKKLLSRIERFQKYHNDQVDSTLRDLNNKKSKEAARIKKDLLQIVHAFTKTHIEDSINKINNSGQLLETFILDDDKYKDLFDTYHATNIKRILNDEIKSDFNFDKLILKVQKLLSQVVIFNPIKELKDNPVLEKWVKTGIALHNEIEYCKFCHNKLEDNFFEKLSQHFTEEKNKLEKDIDNLITEVENEKIKLHLDDPANIYQELTETYQSIKNKIELDVIEINKMLDSLKNSLTEKQLKIEQSRTIDVTINTTDVTINTTLLNDEIQKLIETIQKNNVITETYDDLKLEASSKLIYHYCAEFIVSVNLNDEENFIKDQENKYLKAKEFVTSLKLEIVNLESTISESVKGAEKINEYIKLFFSKEDITIESTDEDKYELKRNGIVAKNLSEGEKTAISFAYFIANLESKEQDDNKLENTIIYLDDPISSLDSNHLINIYAFIKRELGVNIKQLFISTHNFEFFNLIKDWLSEKNSRIVWKNKERMKKGQTVKPVPGEFFMVKNDINGTKRIAKLVSLEDTLKNFKSEYQYLFYLLYVFNKKEDFTFSELYQINNIARRFIELFTTFKIPRSGDWKSKIEEILKQYNITTDIEKVYKLTNTYSHQTNPMSAVNHIDKVETKSGLSTLFEIIEKADKLHFDALEKHCITVV